MRIDDEKSVSSDSESPGDGKKGKVKKQEKQKKIVVNFVEAMTCPTEETLQDEPIKCNDQNLPPLDKQRLVELFEQHINTKDISTSVFWKYTKREVYVDRNVFRNRKTGGYKGFSGVQWRNPDRPEDLAVIEPRLHRIRRYLTRGKEPLVQNLRDILSGEDSSKGLKVRRKKPGSTPGKGLEGAQEDVTGAHMLVQAAALSGQFPHLALGDIAAADVMAVVAAAQRERDRRPRRSGDSDDEDDLLGPPPAKKMKIHDHNSTSSLLAASSGSLNGGTTNRTLLSSSSLSPQPVSSASKSPLPPYQHPLLQEQHQLISETVANSVNHLQLVYQSLSTHTAIEMLKLLNDPEVLAALQNLKAIAPIINQQLGPPDAVSGQDTTHG